MERYKNMTGDYERVFYHVQAKNFDPKIDFFPTEVPFWAKKYFLRIRFFIAKCIFRQFVAKEIFDEKCSKATLWNSRVPAWNTAGTWLNMCLRRFHLTLQVGAGLQGVKNPHFSAALIKK